MATVSPAERGAALYLGLDAPAEPCVLVIFGGSGDLTKRLLVPALYNLACDGLLSDRFAIVGTPEDCARKIHEAAEAGARHFWMSVHFPDKEAFMKEWSETVMKSVN